MNRGSMSKQISTAPKSKYKKVKKMQFGGMAMQQSPRPAGMGPGTPVTAAEPQLDPARRAEMQAQMEGMPLPSRPGAPTEVALPLKPGMGRPGMGPGMGVPQVSLPGKPGMGRPGMGPGMGEPQVSLPGKPGMGRPGMGPGRPGMGEPQVSLPRGPRPGMGPGRPGMGDMPRGPGRGGPDMTRVKPDMPSKGNMPPPNVRGSFSGQGPGRVGPAIGAMAGMKKGGVVKKAKGGKIDGCCMKGHTRARMK